MKDLDIERWSKMYESSLDEAYAPKLKPHEVLEKLEQEVNDHHVRADIKIVVGNKFYDIHDVYTIDEDENDRGHTIYIECNGN